MLDRVVSRLLVTTLNFDDAIDILRKNAFVDAPMPPPTSVVEDVDISQLDQRHVRPNMGDWDPTLRVVRPPVVRSSSSVVGQLFDGRQ